VEELRSTEVLDREILEDARKKAFKILKTSDDTVQSQTKRWEKKTVKAVADIRKTYTQRLETLREEILARLPLDKRRLRSETAEHFLRDAMEAFLQNLPRGEVLAILEKQFTERAEACAELSNSKTAVVYSGMSEAEILGILKKSKLKEWDLKKDEGTNAARLPALTLNVPAAKISASVDDAAMELLEEKRAELIKALLGEGALND
jgi:vacuolar-type H+-ATPase subunit E/Vma4